MDWIPFFRKENTIEVGETDDHLRFYITKLAYENTNKEAERQDIALQRLKTRATSLLGWTVTLTSLSGAAFFTSPIFKVALLLSAMMFMNTGFLCVMTLYSTKWIYPYFHMESLKDMEKSSELEFLEQIELNQRSLNAENLQSYKTVQLYMKIGWWLFATTPLITFIVVLVSNYLNYQN